MTAVNRKDIEEFLSVIGKAGASLADMERALNRAADLLAGCLPMMSRTTNPQDVWGTLEQVEFEGNCSAWRYNLHGGCHVLFTDGCGLNFPQEGDDVNVGLYDWDDNEMLTVTGLAFDDIRRLCEFFSVASGRGIPAIAPIGDR